MINTKLKMLFYSIVVILCVGCSSGDGNPALMNSTNSASYPDINNPDFQIDEISSRSFQGIWAVDYDLVNLTASISPSRIGFSHFEISGFLPVPAIEVISYNTTTGILDVDLTIENPWQLDGFDLRLIMYSTDSGILLLNPDGWTDLWDIAGGAQINPFKSYAKHYPLRRFERLSEHTERHQLYFPSGTTSVSYAIDVSYPSNCEEPYSIEKFTQGQLDDVTGAETYVEVDVLDHQQNVDWVSLYCPSITGESFVQFSHSSNNTWGMTLVNHTGASEGEFTAFLVAESPGGKLYKDVKIIVANRSACHADDNNHWTEAENLSLVDSVTGCVDLTDDDWFVFYTPPNGILSGTIELTILTEGGVAGLTLFESSPGEDAPGTLVSEDYITILDNNPASRYMVNIAGISGRVVYELAINVVPQMTTVDCAIFVATDDGTEDGTWPVWESPDPDEELTITHLENLISWTNSIYNQYGYNLNWDGTVTIMESRYYNLDGQDWEMHDQYGRGTDKISMYFEQSTGSAYCFVFYDKNTQNVNNAFSVYGPNVWYWESVGAHEWGHVLGYLFDEYLYSSTECDCGDNVCLGYTPWLYWCDDGCYYGSIMWYCIVGDGWEIYSFTNGQAQYVNRFHFEYPDNFPWY